ncbi:erythromycin esterase family protein [Paenibacillus tengchongensis]|uniref:erythromycin esterase family protein n=1 Tax=Paenibacillus tengchongensis TaxID=2608684 RepID=UPI00124DE6EF|nr:erythromycin esterase family protein [Paenibacillus tengchongensis]
MREDLLMESIHRLAIPFGTRESIDRLIKHAAKAQYVLLGEASHGTSDFYTVRAELSKRLIAEHGFRFIAVEGDWPACYTLNRYVKGYSDAATEAETAMNDFNRWPTWMWANREILELAGWLREFNQDKPDAEKVGFYGIDVYSLWESMDEILKYLETQDKADLEAARKAFECFEPFGRDEQSYGISASLYGEGCEDQVIALLGRLQDKWKDAHPEDQERALSAELNAMAVKGAESYYSTMIRHDAESWNIRDRHMVSALEKLVEFHGEHSRVLVWEHNTHIGDARATDMADEGMVNVGQLLREQYGSQVYAIGFGTYEGTVIAGRSWGAPMEEMKVPPAIRNSWEELLHRNGAQDQLLLMDPEDPVLGEITVGHRAIGVVYHPERERGNYVPTVISRRYNAFIYLDHTKALRPLALSIQGYST